MSSIEQVVATVRQRAPQHQPRVGLILGTGLGGVADQIQNPVEISYQDLPGFPLPKVEGHAGRMTLGDLAGIPVVVLRGRVHLYEGEGTEPLKIMVRSLKALGVDFLFLTNAAGSLRTDFKPGELVAMTDHINFMGTNPLVGPNEPEHGPRFVDLEHSWDPKLRDILKQAAQDSNTTLHEGVFAGWMGPCFETPAEIRMLAKLGCDTVGMSMVPENIVARHCGLRCVGVSAITNFAVGLTDEKVSHEQNLEVGERAAKAFEPLLKSFLKRYGSSVE